MNKSKKTANEVKADEIQCILTLASVLNMHHVSQLNLKAMNLVHRADLLKYLQSEFDALPKIEILPPANDGLGSCGKIEMVLTDHNVKSMLIMKIIRLNSELRNSPLNSTTLEALSIDEVKQLCASLELQLQSKLN